MSLVFRTHCGMRDTAHWKIGKVRGDSGATNGCGGSKDGGRTEGERRSCLLLADGIEYLGVTSWRMLPWQAMGQPSLNSEKFELFGSRGEPLLLELNPAEPSLSGVEPGGRQVQRVSRASQAATARDA